MANRQNLDERTIDNAETDAAAARMRARGMAYRAIATEQGCSVSSAHARVQRAIAAVPVEAVNELRAIECERLDADLAMLYASDECCLKILESDHYVVSDGRLVKDDGTPLADTAPILAALNVMRANAAERRKISESRRKLLGLDAPSRRVVEVVTESVLDEEIRRLLSEAATLEGALADVEPVDR